MLRDQNSFLLITQQQSILFRTSFQFFKDTSLDSIAWALIKKSLKVIQHTALHSAVSVNLIKKTKLNIYTT